MTDQSLLCPSAQPNQPGAQVFGVQTETEHHGRRVGYLTEAVPLTPEVLALSGSDQPPEVLRIAAPCMHGGCLHHEAGACALGARIARMLDPVVSSLPRCAIRPHCRWFAEQGPAACVRCPQVVTNARDGSNLPLDVIYPGGVIPDGVGPKP
jgi:hypothetical protein